VDSELRPEGSYDDPTDVLPEIVEREPRSVFVRLDRALEVASESAWAQGARGQVLQGLDQTEEVLDGLRNALELDPSLPSAWSELGNALTAAGKPDGAVSAFDRALELGADRIETLKLKAFALCDLQLWQQALEILEELLGERPQDAAALAAQGQAYRVLERYPEAIASFRQALDVNPSTTWFLGEFAEALRRMEEYDEALAMIDRALAEQGQTAWNVGTRGQILNSLGDTPAALEALTRAVELEPDLAWAQNDIGYILSARAEYEPALVHFNAALEHGAEPFALAGKGQVLRVLGRSAEAIEVLEQAVELNPNVAWFHAERGEVLRTMERFAEALKELNRALELEPGNSWAMASFAGALYGAERYDEALEQLNQVVDQDPAYAFALGTRGEIWCELAEWKAAIADLSQAVELDTTSAWYRGILGWAFENEDQPAAALESYAAACKLDSDSVFWQRGHAEALYALRKPDALGEFERVVETWGSTADPQAEESSVVGWCYYRLGKYDQAVRCYTNVIASSGEPEPTQFDLALVMAASGRETLAAPEYERAIEMLRKRPPRRQRGLLVVARRDVRVALKRLEDDAARRALIAEEDAARQALAVGGRMLEVALAELDTPALAST
jgi:tetratricopeptide (TPR) repeat protein